MDKLTVSQKTVQTCILLTDHASAWSINDYRVSFNCRPMHEPLSAVRASWNIVRMNLPVIHKRRSAKQRLPLTCERQFTSALKSIACILAQTAHSREVSFKLKIRGWLRRLKLQLGRSIEPGNPYILRLFRCHETIRGATLSLCL
jgi:hypothetical protein